jgi:hypothetical protein
MSALESAVNTISKHITREFGAKPVTIFDVQNLLQKKGWVVRESHKRAGWWVRYGSTLVGWTDFGDPLRVCKPAKIG